MMKFQTEKGSYKPHEGIALPIQITASQLILTKNVHHMNELYLTSVKNVIICAFGRNDTIQKVCKDISLNTCNALGLDPRQ